VRGRIVPKNDFVDIWVVFDATGGCLGWMNDSPYYKWSAALEGFVFGMKYTDWTLRKAGEDPCPFGTTDAARYNVFRTDYDNGDCVDELLAITVAIRATAL